MCGVIARPFGTRKFSFSLFKTIAVVSGNAAHKIKFQFSFTSLLYFIQKANSTLGCFTDTTTHAFWQRLPEGNCGGAFAFPHKIMN